MNLIQRAREFFTSPDSALVCPRCEKPLEGHDQAACDRRMSRRFFFGAIAGGVVAVAAAPAITTLKAAEYRPVWHVDEGAVGGNYILSPQDISREMLKILNANMEGVREIQRLYNRHLTETIEVIVSSPPLPKIGDTFQVRRPARFR